MKVLIVCSEHSGLISPFITEQVDSLISMGLEMDYFLVDKKGISGYLSKRKGLLDKIKQYQPNVIHAHYGLSGLLANLQRHVPVVTTYLGSDINYPRVLIFSRISMILSAHNIFVSENIRKKSGLNRKQSLIPFGVITKLFFPVEKNIARKELGLDLTKKLVLFAGSFQNSVKNPELAKLAVAMIPNVELLRTGGGFTREQIAMLMNAVDVALMTSFTEGSPQFIKEVMSCNCPIVSVPVGDVPEITENLDGCFIASYEVVDVVEKLQEAFDFGKRTEGRRRIVDLQLDIESVGKKILEIYKGVIDGK